MHTDDLLDGWDDQFTFWERLEEQVLRSRCGTAGPPRIGAYLWDAGPFGGQAGRASSRRRSYSWKGSAARG